MTPETETQRVFEVLKGGILRQEFAPGTPLSHSQLCRDLNTSRTPVREALSRLEGLGLVTTVPHRGTFVAQIDLQDFLEITQIRALIEPFAARQAAGRVPLERIDQLTRELKQLEGSRQSDADISALQRIDAEIHRLVGAGSGNHRLDSLAETLLSLCAPFSHDSRLRFHTMVGELLGLLAALRAGDADAAEDTMRAHINNFGEALPRLVQ